MHNLKAILAVLSVTLLPSCILEDFDDLKDKTYVHSQGKGGIEASGFGTALIATGGTEGLNYYVVAANSPTVLHVNFDVAGNRSEIEPQLLAGPFAGLPPLIDKPAVASDRSSFSNPGGARVALGIVHDSTGKVVIMDANYDASDTPSPRIITNIPLEGGQAPTSIAFGTSNAAFADTDTVDLMAISGQQLNLIADYQSMVTSEGNCSLQMGGGTVLLADVDPNSPGDEVIVADENRVFVASALELQTRMGMDQNCGLGVEIGTEVGPVTGATSFGGSLAFGNFGGMAQPDLVVSDHESNAVYVYMDWTPAAPTEPVKLPTPEGSVAFGTAIAVGDFDGDGLDELVVGDPKKVIGAHPEAGTAYIYSGDGASGFGSAIFLHDARADDNQNFGRSLAVAPAFGSDRLIVGAKDEVFTYFRTPLSGDADFR